MWKCHHLAVGLVARAEIERSGNVPRSTIKRLHDLGLVI